MSGLIVASVMTVALTTGSPVAAGEIYSEDHVVERGDTLREIAAAHGSSIGAIADANAIDDPDLIHVGTVLVIPAWGGSVSGGSGSAEHVVEPGDTLASIAVRYGTSISSIVAANTLPNPDLIVIGQRLHVAGATHGDRGPQGGGGSSGTGGAVGTDLSYVVRGGDTLGNIASAFGVSGNALLAANSISDPDLIRVGQTLTIPAGGTSGGGMLCPVPGAFFVDDYLYVKPTGRVHQGVDLHATEWTPVQAPVTGMAQLINGPLGGLQFWLYGNDANLYIGTHLAGFGPGMGVSPSGPDTYVTAGDVIGYVGNTGNAIGGPTHLHYEVHVGGEPVNPHPLLIDAC